MTSIEKVRFFNKAAKAFEIQSREKKMMFKKILEEKASISKLKYAQNKEVQNIKISLLKKDNIYLTEKIKKISIESKLESLKTNKNKLDKTEDKLQKISIQESFFKQTIKIVEVKKDRFKELKYQEEGKIAEWEELELIQGQAHRIDNNSEMSLNLENLRDNHTQSFNNKTDLKEPEKIISSASPDQKIFEENNLQGPLVELQGRLNNNQNYTLAVSLPTNKKIELNVTEGAEEFTKKSKDIKEALNKIGFNKVKFYNF